MATPRNPPAGLRARLLRHLRHPLIRNGYALVLNSGSGAVLGMAFWVVAARRYDVGTVGVNAALIAALTLLSTISQLNLSNVLNRFLPGAGRRTGRVILGCYLASVGMSVVVGLVFLAGTARWSPELAFVSRDPRLSAWFLLALALWSLFVLQDGALSGLRRSSWVFGKNTVFGAVKLLVLLLPAVVAMRTGIFLAWTVSMVPLLVVGNVLMFRRLVAGRVADAAPARASVAVRPIARFVAADYVVALAGTGLISALPILVLELSGDAEAAYFSIAWSISYTLYLVSRGMATSLLVEGATEPARLGEYSYRAAVQTGVLLAPLVAATVLLAPLLMRVFGPQYAEGATTVLRLLALSAIPSAVIVVYSAVERVQGRMLRLVVVTLVVNVGALALSALLLETYGLAGIGVAWLLTQAVAATGVLLTVLLPLWLPHLDARLLTRLVRPVRGVRERVRRRRELRLLRSDYPAVAQALGLDPAWRVLRVVTTVGDVSVALLGAGCPAALLKYARTPAGTEALTYTGGVVDTLAGDPRLAAWTCVLPRRLGSTRTARGDLVVVEELLPGEDGRAVLGSAARDAGVASVLASAATLHTSTGRAARVDDPLLRAWVDEPVAVLAGWYTDAGRSSPAALDRLRDVLRAGLEGREVSVGWVHGDLAPGNVLLSTDGRQVRGLVDWERATSTGLPQVDGVHLLLTVRMLTEGRELGDLVCDLLPRARDEAAGAVQPGNPTAEPTGDPLDDPVLVLLTWLHHVSGIVAKTDHYAPRSVWAARNVDVVLDQLNQLDQAGHPGLAWAPWGSPPQESTTSSA